MTLSVCGTTNCEETGCGLMEAEGVSAGCAYAAVRRAVVGLVVEGSGGAGVGVRLGACVL